MSQTIDAACRWGTIANTIEVEEDARVADTIAFQIVLKIASKCEKVLSDRLDSTLIARVSNNLFAFIVVNGHVAVVEVVVGFSCGRNIQGSVF